MATPGAVAASVEKQFSGSGSASEVAVARALLTEVRYTICRGANDSAAGILSTLALEHDTPFKLFADPSAQTVVYTPGFALTAADATCAVLQLVYNNANGGADTIIATANTATTGSGGTGNWTAGVPVNIPVIAANSVVPADNAVFLKITKTGAGTVVPMGTLVVKFRAAD